MSDLKTCTGCKEAKPLTQYHKHRQGHGGLRPTCKACVRAYYLANRDKQLAYQRARDPRALLEIRVRSIYGLTIEEYEELQAAGCGVCGAAESSGKSKALHVDHDHSCCPGRRSCGKCVRGALCTSCNQGLGRFKDDPDRLVAAAVYLIQSRDVAIVLTANDMERWCTADDALDRGFVDRIA